jgi:hypothetical protein
MCRPAQLPREAVTFVATKVTKKACQQTGFFSHMASALQIRPKPSRLLSGQNVAPLRSLLAPLQPRTFGAMPLPALKATIVLPDFARSFSADGGKIKQQNHS